MNNLQSHIENPYPLSHTIYKICTPQELEPSSTVELFPHIYDDLKIEYVSRSQLLKTHEFDFNTLL